MVWFQLSQPKNEMKSKRFQSFASFFCLSKLNQNVLLLKQGKRNWIDSSRLWVTIFTSFIGKQTHTHTCVHTKCIACAFLTRLWQFVIAKPTSKPHFYGGFFVASFSFVRLIFSRLILLCNFSSAVHWVAHVVYTIHAYQIKITYLLTLFTWCILRAINHVEMWQRQVIRTGHFIAKQHFIIIKSKTQKEQKQEIPHIY